MKGHLKETVRGLFLIVDHEVSASTPMLYERDMRVNVPLLVHCLVLKRCFLCPHQPSSYWHRIINCRPQLIIMAKASVHPM